MERKRGNGVCRLLEPKECALIFIDHQPQMSFGVGSMDRQLLVNNVVGLAKSGRVFKVPTILTTISSRSFSGLIWPQLQEVFPAVEPIERTCMNAWEDKGFVSAVRELGRKRLVMAALWTEVCLAFPVLSALGAGYEVYVVVDASAGTSVQVHETAVKRLIQAGAAPVTWMQVLLEWQRDWSRKATYDATLEVIKEHGGAYGQGVEYVATMVHGGSTAAKTQAPGRRQPVRTR